MKYYELLEQPFGTSVEKQTTIQAKAALVTAIVDEFRMGSVIQYKRNVWQYWHKVDEFPTDFSYNYRVDRRPVVDALIEEVATLQASMPDVKFNLYYCGQRSFVLWGHHGRPLDDDVVLEAICELECKVAQDDRFAGRISLETWEGEYPLEVEESWKLIWSASHLTITHDVVE